MGLYLLPVYPDLQRGVFFDDFIGASYNNRIWAVTGTGGITSLAEIGGRIRVRANAASSYRINLGDVGNFTISGNASGVWRGKMIPATAASGMAECGFQASTTPTSNYIRWRYEPNASGNFRCICTSGGTSTTVDSGVAGDNLDHEFRVECSTGEARFYLDGLLKTTITTNVPTGQLQPFAGCTGSAAVVSDLDADFFYGIGDRV